MNDLHAPLSEEEAEELEVFLLGRDPDEIWRLGMDEGVVAFAELDGFLTAIVSGPEPVPPSRWLPALWGDFEPRWEDERQFQHLLTLMSRHMNGIAQGLMYATDEFEPVFPTYEVNGELVEDPAIWCMGYLRAMSLTLDAWTAGGEECARLLTPLNAACDESWSIETIGADARRFLRKSVRENVRALYRFWLSRRRPPQPLRKNDSTPGRNDPCPCGSGRKYKKCCLQ